ncbi:MAG: hypothetical protein ACXWT1_16225 [Methylobacter sp.]
MKIGNFTSEAEAQEYFKKMHLTLLVIPCRHEIGVNSPKDLSSINIYDHPINNRDAEYNGREAAIVSNQLKLSKFTGFVPSGKFGINSENIISTIKELISIKITNRLLADSKLLLALELYSNYYFEESKYSKFIILINILEALSPSLGDEKISVFSQNELLLITKELKEKMPLYEKDGTEYNELQSLCDRISKLEDKGTTGLILKYIKNIVKDNPGLGNPNKISSKIDEAYNARSALLHDGKMDPLELDKYLSFLCPFITKLLNVLVRA